MTDEQSPTAPPIPPPSVLNAELKYETDWTKRQFDQPHPGRPSLYQKQYSVYAKRMCSIGATIKDIANLFNVNIDTIYEWKVRHIEFSDALSSSRSEADATVEASLYKRATGFVRVVEKVTQQGDVVQTKEEIPPDIGSMIFWLKNRQPHRWSDKRELEVSGNVSMTAIIAEKEKPIDITPSSPELENYPVGSVQDAQSSALALLTEPVNTIRIDTNDCKVQVSNDDKEIVRMVGGPTTTPNSPVQKLSHEVKPASKSKKISTKSKARGKVKKADPYAPA